MCRLVAPIVLLASLALMPGRTRADVAPAGPEFQVNTYTTGDQTEPKVAADGSGRFVVVWQSGSYYGNGPDGYGYGVAARRFDAAGTPAGAEFVVNTYTAGPQESPAVAAAPGGDFLVAWQGGDFRSEQDGSASGAFVQRFAGSGTRVGQELRGNTVVRGFQVKPAVAFGSSGDSMVVWESAFFGFPPGGDGEGFGIFAQHYDAAGTPVGGEFQVNTFTSGNQTSPAVAADPSGGFVIVWESGGYPSEDGSGSGIFGRRIAASGVPSGGEFPVNSFTSGFQANPAVASDPAGGFVIVWDSNYSTGGPADRDGDGVFGRRFDAGGSPVAPEFQVNSYTTGTQQTPAVAADGDGNFVVVWVSANFEGGTGQDGSRQGVFGQHFLSTGDRVGGEFQVNTYTTGDQTEPAIVAGPDGDFVVVWTSGYPTAQDGNGSGIFAQRFRTSGFEPPHAATGRRLALRDDTADPRKQRLTLRADDTTIGIGSGAGSRDDPTSFGGSVHVTSAQFDQTYALPASGWRRVSDKGYRYRATASSSGPVSDVVVRPGGIRITGKGAALGLALATNPDPVTVVLQLGSAGVRDCMSFGGTTSYQPGRRYRAQDAPAVATCGR
jgi:hypothetical protein